jgi:hypothetical protein
MVGGDLLVVNFHIFPILLLRENKIPAIFSLLTQFQAPTAFSRQVPCFWRQTRLVFGFFLSEASGLDYSESPVIIAGIVGLIHKTNVK